MSTLRLWFASGEEGLSVRRFAVREGLSALFEVNITARSPNDDVDLAALVGKPAAFRLVHALANAAPASRAWRGICSHAEQTHVERNGLSTYELRIVPILWLLTQRRNHRIFQHESIPAIVTRLLAEWGIETAWHVDRAAYPKLEYRVQYGETDFAFVSRLLEEAGICHRADDTDEGSKVALFDAIELGDIRADGPVRYVDHPNEAAQREYVTRVRIAHEVRPDKFTLRDFDFRRKPDYPLFATAALEKPDDGRLERYVYAPGSFVAEGAKGGDTPVADDKGVARAQEKIGHLRAERALAAERVRKRRLAFDTNVAALCPGTIFSIEGHSHTDVAPNHRWLVEELSLEGEHNAEWHMRGRAVLADIPYRPLQTTPKPVVQGVQSAIVVGPRGEEIHTDELGRVRVQFPWDREGTYSDGSSCWIRVSQGWAGGGYGFLALPRVGHEVVVGFFEGDPDQPIIVGRVFNATTGVPYTLPEHRTRTTWRGASSPGGDGFNEITFEDFKGRERVYMQAERDLEKLVKADESAAVGGSRSRKVAVNETVSVTGNQAINVGALRSTTVGGADDITVGGRHSVTVLTPTSERPELPPTGLEIMHRRITLTTGEATITLDGPNVILEAAADILLSAASNITITGRSDIHVSSGANVLVRADEGDLLLCGGPTVHINPPMGSIEDADFLEKLPVEAPDGVSMDAEVEDAHEASRFDERNPNRLASQLAAGGAWDPHRFGPEHIEFGYFNLGVKASAAGIPEGALLRQMGKRTQAENGGSTEHGDPGNGLFGGTAPYGNLQEHYERIKEGTAYHRRNYLFLEDDHDA